MRDCVCVCCVCFCHLLPVLQDHCLQYRQRQNSPFLGNQLWCVARAAPALLSAPIRARSRILCDVARGRECWPDQSVPPSKCHSVLDLVPDATLPPPLPLPLPQYSRPVEACRGRLHPTRALLATRCLSASACDQPHHASPPRLPRCNRHNRAVLGPAGRDQVGHHCPRLLASQCCHLCVLRGLREGAAETAA